MIMADPLFRFVASCSEAITKAQGSEFMGPGRSCKVWVVHGTLHSPRAKLDSQQHSPSVAICGSDGSVFGVGGGGGGLEFGGESKAVVF